MTDSWTMVPVGFIVLVLLCVLQAEGQSFPKACTALRPIYLIGNAVPDRYQLPRGVNLIYDDEGYVHAFSFSKQAQTLRFPASNILTRCSIFPEEFSILVTLKLPPNSVESIDNEYIFALMPEQSLEVKLGLRLSKGRIIFDYTDYKTTPGTKRTSVFKVADIFDGKWHTFVLTVTAKIVGLRVDCKEQKYQKLRRSFPAWLNTTNNNVHIANGKTLTNQFSGLLKQLILLPGSDASRLACPSLTPSLPTISRGWENDTPHPGKPSEVEPKYSDLTCSWASSGKVVFDIATSSLRTCVGGIWQSVTDLQGEKRQKRLDYLEQYQNIITTTPAIDVEVFRIQEEGLFMAMANYDSQVMSKQPSTIYKWTDGKFSQYQNLTTLGAQNWEHFVIDRKFFLAVANYGISRDKSSTSVIYKWSKRRKKFRVYQEIVTYTARDFEYFKIEDEHYLAVANHAKGTKLRIDSVIYKYDRKSRYFEQIQTIPTTAAYDWTHFTVGAYHFLVVANAFDGVSTRMDSAVYFWQKGQFIFAQSIETTGATDWEVIRIGSDLFLAVANAYNYGPQNHRKLNEYTVNSTIYKLNLQLKQFEKFQNIETNSIVDWETFTVGNDTFLIASNAQHDSDTSASVVYRWQGVEKFVPVHHLTDSVPCTDWESFTEKDVTYLINANAKSTLSQVLKVKTW
ncbi:thrombospondin-type laminin G domain and EAR repeat-containing protein [Lingula anatina]|uniref:Thrombospondin-type laminin G domain and EAR repeat-containing protein n=1 Tax=Lingula anatina TaxID=7574 RepID=A0A1S3IAR8_LINAN|nr:thrombospondin-type laminin G domain and EAR repeat-containing protein [Lingula anatina]|eukprot:XP_013394951.1 thrombospondin-type laminin G domain and EAR repeat-containing protein [Lingula anatina]